MAHLEQKQAMMANVPILAAARRLLDLPDHVKYYGQLKEWGEEHGHKVPEYVVEAFQILCNGHYKEYEGTKKTSHVGMQRSNATTTSPSKYDASRALYDAGRIQARSQKMAQNVAYKKDQSPMQRQLVNAFGEAITDDTAAHDEAANDGGPQSSFSGKSQAHASSHQSSNSFWGSRPHSYKSKSGKIFSGSSSAADESFARQVRANPMIRNPDSTPQERLLSFAKSMGIDDLASLLQDPVSDRLENSRDAIPEHGNQLGHHDKSDADQHRTSDSFVRQINANNIAKVESKAKELAGQANAKVVKTTAAQVVGWKTGEEAENKGVVW